MSRALANHRLYLAEVLLRAWQRELENESWPVQLLEQAYAPGVREHLVFAYGSFLLAVLDPTAQANPRPPRCCAELPPLEPGKALPGEIREFMALEREGWLAQLIAPLPTLPPETHGSRAMNLLAPSSGYPDLATCRQWHRSLQSLIERMNDALDEC